MHADMVCFALIELQSVLRQSERLLQAGGYPAWFEDMPVLMERIHGAMALLDDVAALRRQCDVDRWCHDALVSGGEGAL